VSSVKGDAKGAGRVTTEDGMQAGKHPQAIATKVLVPRCLGLMRGSRSRARCRPLTVSVALSFCTAASALVSASTGGEPNAKVAAPDVARKRRRDKRKHTPSTVLPPTEFRPRRGTSTISYPSPGGGWPCANFRQNAEQPGFRWRLVPAPLQRPIDAFDQRLSACRQNTVASISKEIPSFCH
jgi:hypothetical protein